MVEDQSSRGARCESHRQRAAGFKRDGFLDLCRELVAQEEEPAPLERRRIGLYRCVVALGAPPGIQGPEEIPLPRLRVWAREPPITVQYQHVGVRAHEQDVVPALGAATGDAFEQERE